MDGLSLRGLSLEKALAIAAYGESVAAFRYRALAERTADAPLRAVFEEMADEERGHHEMIQALLRKEFPGEDFILSESDKELVIVGSRALDVSTPEAFRRTMELLHASELRTGRFYAALHDTTDRTDLKPMLKEMADECFDHAGRLKELGND